MSKKHSHLWSLPPEKVSLPLPPEKVSYPRRSLILRLALLAFFLSLLALYCRPSRPLYSPPNADLDIDTLLLNLPSTANLRNDLKYYTSTAHVAGTEADRQQAEWTRDKFREYGIDRAEVQEYWPYLNYPVSRRLAVVQAPEEGLLFEAGLREDVVEGDETSKMQDAVPTFHGYSANGNVTARLVYANYGAPADFAYLDSLGVNVTGAIILVRYGDYGDIDRGVKVRAAELRGAAGVVIYSDPAEDGCAQKPKYPAGTCRPESSVQRGSVAYDFYPGDPLTPGWAAEKDAPRIDPTEAKVLPRIPSLPISYRDALPLLRALVGTGTNLTDDGWRGALDTEYWTGPSEALVNLVNEVEYKITPVWNVIGRIEGWEEPDKIVIIGNHRDAWVFGAADPNSGSVALLEVVRSFGILLKFGWRPRRTILFASWDAEEYSLIGSTEFVENHLPTLQRSLVAYINVDVAVVGPHFLASASFSLTHLIRNVTALVVDPLQPNRTIRENWLATMNNQLGMNLSKPEVYPLGGAGSDYTAFLDHLGAASVDIGFFGSYGVYHSNYDSFNWADKQSDPGFFYHAAITKIMSLLTARLSDSPLLPLNATHYAHMLPFYVAMLNKTITRAQSERGLCVAYGVDLNPLLEAIEEMLKRARGLERDREEVRKELEKRKRKGGKEEKKWRKRRDSVNQRVMILERGFIDQDGLPGRPWYKHVILAPALWEGYGVQPFPGIADLTEAGECEKANEEVRKVAEIIRKAGKSLE